MPHSIAFIGLGIMGRPMALNLVKARHKVTVFNRDRAKTANRASRRQIPAMARMISNSR